MANEGIELQIYKYSDPKAATPAWILPGAKSPKYLDEIDSVGGGSFFLPRNDPKLIADPTLLDSRNICKLKVNGDTIGAFILGSRESKIVTSGERAEQGYQIAGEGLKTWFDDATVSARGGISLQTGKNRHFNFATEEGNWYKPADWVTPYVMAKVHAPSPWTINVPKDPMAKWPSGARNADWIWASPYADPQNPAWCYFRWTVNVTDPGNHAIYLAVDNHYVLFVDGEQISKSGDGYFWHTIDRHEVTLSAGPHVIGIQARNRNASEGYRGPAAVLASLFSLAGGTKEGVEKVVSYSRPTAEWKALAYPTVVPGWSVGEVMLKLLEEAEDRGVLFPTWLTPTFTATLDSNGQPWSDNTAWAFSIGQSYKAVIEQLEEFYDIWIDPDTYELNIVPTRGEVHNIDHAKPITFFLGKHLREASTQAKGKIKNTLAINGEQGWTEETEAASIAKYGRLEGAMTVDDLSLSGTVADLVFSQRAQEEEGASYALVSFDYIPYVDFVVGDWVYAPNERGESVPRRVMSISVEGANDTGTPVYTIEFDTIFRDNEDRINKVLSKLGGGGVGGSSSSGGGIVPGGGNGGEPLPPDTTPRLTTPKPPTGLIVESVGSWSANGVQPLSTATLTWDPVTQNIDDSATTPFLYEVWGKDTTALDTTFELRGSTSALTLELANLIPGAEWEYKVRAQNLDGGYSEYSTVTSEVMEGPTAPMVAPSVPFVVSSSGLIIVTWNGLMSDGQPPPPQFRYMFAQHRVISPVVGNWTQSSSTLSRDGRQITIAGMPLGYEFELRLVAVDGMGILSAASGTASVTVVGVDLGNLDQEVQDAIDAAQAAGDAAQATATAAQIAAGLAQDDVDTLELDVDALALEVADVLATAEDALSTASGMMTWSPNAPTTGDGSGKPIGAIWYRTGANGIVAQWQWNGTIWTLRPIDSDAIFSLNAVKITAGTLDAARIAARSIAAEKLLIGNLNNLFPDPNFDNPTLSGWNASVFTHMPGGGRQTWLNALRITGTGAQRGAYNVATNIPVQPNDRFYLAIWVRASAAVASVSNLLGPYFQIDRIGTTQVTGGLNSAMPLAANTWTKLTGTLTIPAEGYRVRPGLYVQSVIPAGVHMDFTEPEMIRISGTTLIADGAITTDKITALAITAAKIAAGTITGDKVAAGTISTSKLMVTSLDNLIEDGSFEYWTATNQSWSMGTGVTVVTTNPRTGTKALRVPGVVKVAATSSAAVKVEAGEQYRLEAWARLETGTMNTTDGITLRITWGATEASTGNITSDLAGVPVTTTTTYVPMTGVWEVPAGAKYARFQVIQRDTDSAKIYYVDDIALYKMGTGDLIVDGTITAAKIGTGEIVSRHVQADAIAAEHIQARAITAEKIAAEAITAEAIAAGAITTNHIAAGAITVNLISPEVGEQLDISANSTVQIIAGQLNGVEEGLNNTQDNLETMQTYYTFGPTGAVISSPGSVFALALRNDRIEMLENGNVVSYWNSGQMYVSQFVGERVTLGNHQLEKYEDGTVVRAL